MNTNALRNAECFLFDMDGTIYLDDQLLPGAEALVAYLAEKKIPHFFLTNNSSRSQDDYVTKLAGLGLHVPQEHIFTSGEATARYLKRQKPGSTVYRVGTPSLEKEFQKHGFVLTNENPDFAVLGFDTTLTYQKLWDLCDFVRGGLPYIATHPDVNCPTADGFMPDIGSMIELVAASTGRRPDIIVGKPYSPIVEAIVEKTGFEAHQIVMVGDRLYTDIALGQAGLTTVLVLSGEANEEDLAESEFQPDFVLENVAERTFYVSKNSYVKVLTDSFSNNHTHQVRNNEVSVVNVQDYAEIGLSISHSHIISPLISVVECVSSTKNGLIAVGNDSIVYNSRDNGSTWNNVGDMNDYIDSDIYIIGSMGLSGEN